MVIASALPSVATPAQKPYTARTLLERGKPETYTGEDLKFIGMPVGGLFAGTVYLGGDGQLWNWDIYNQEHYGCIERPNTTFMGESLNAGSGANYVDPVRQTSPFSQHFALYVQGKAPEVVRFGEVTFRGEYPVGKVTFREADADVEMSLVAFSPFIPLDVERSSYPATTQTYKIRNTGSTSLDLRMVYHCANPVLAKSRVDRDDIDLHGELTSSGGLSFSAVARPTGAAREDILYEDWSSGTYHGWTATGTSFGDAPRLVSDLPSYMGPVHAGTKYVVNTHNNRHGEDVVQADQHTGRLVSPQFAITRKYINMRVGGGSNKELTCIRLRVNGKIVRSVSGRDSNVMNWESWLVSDFEGKDAQIEVVDEATGGWGQISLGEVEFSDKPKVSDSLEQLPDYGTFCIEVLGGANLHRVDQAGGEVGKAFKLGPGESAEVTFCIAWHFPNCGKVLPGTKNWYATKWPSAEAVAKDLLGNWTTLAKTTLEWNRTWYDSTLPFWFLDRTFLNTSILATTTCHRLDAGRYYFWEGSGCCAGTCTHVWGYAQAIGRVFPEVERYLRKEIDFGMAYHKDTGAIDYRAEFHQIVATDGQASCILRAYREHLTSPNNDFLNSIWPQVKGAMTYLIRQDTNADGILDGAQYNTLDTAWFGEIAWISSLYVAALLACEQMAQVMSDSAFAKQCASLAASGSQRLVKDLFNGEYFENKADEAHPEANNTRTGCHIDQIYGQSWAHQVGLGRVVPKAQAQAALKALYKYNFYEDVWEYRRKNHGIPGGRWYAAPKEPGLIMTSFPKGGGAASVGKGGDAWAVQYFNECMSGFEYQAASHMIAEGLVAEGMRVVKAIHERYQPSKRNPYNEVECSDHYGRAMASFGAYIALVGLDVNGPEHKMSFSPSAGKNLRCAFINEQGWGTFERRNGADTVTYAYRQEVQKS